MKNVKKIVTYLFIAGVALIYALSYTLFVFPNKFAPAGLSGICTMVQYVFGIKDTLDSVGLDSSHEKTMLRNTIITIDSKDIIITQKLYWISQRISHGTTYK